MKKICHITSSHNTSDGRIFKKECCSLANKYNVTLIGPGTKRTENNVTVIGINGNPDSRFQRFIFFPLKIIKELKKNNYDLVHIHDPELIPLIPYLSKRYKVIFDSHENVLEEDYNRKWIIRPLQKSIANIAYNIFRNCLHYADVIITVSPHIVESLKKVNEHVFMVTNYPIYVEYKNTQHKKYDLCFTGAINSMWNINMILDAIADIDDIKVAICGPVDADYLVQLKRNESWKKIEYFGVVDFKTAVKIQTESKIGLALLEKYNGTAGNYGTLGNTKLFEYMMAGVPVICTDFILWNDILRKYNCGISVNPKSIDEIKKSIKYLLDKPAIRQQMAINGHNAVKNEYNWEHETKNLFKAYSTILGD